MKTYDVAHVLTEGAAAAMSDPDDADLAEIRYWKSPRWRYDGAGTARVVSLVIHHPATGGATASFDYAAATPEEEAASKLELVQWANDKAGSRRGPAPSAMRRGRAGTTTARGA